MEKVSVTNKGPPTPVRSLILRTIFVARDWRASVQVARWSSAS